ncbi:hypothetical protein I4F81_007409 [Pyropia yezoensis]|uniref:Uncharacterized protein n=1 Tax=Pyropia yezoensis TaxID=2788 RepID=A0ACC3C500_PYRYE|nr:hypothetical protein I4F81_007409 [Neopyropia yezoensis]
MSVHRGRMGRWLQLLFALGVIAVLPGGLRRLLVASLGGCRWRLQAAPWTLGEGCPQSALVAGAATCALPAWLALVADDTASTAPAGRHVPRWRRGTGAARAVGGGEGCVSLFWGAGRAAANGSGGGSRLRRGGCGGVGRGRWLRPAGRGDLQGRSRQPPICAAAGGGPGGLVAGGGPRRRRAGHIGCRCRRWRRLAPIGAVRRTPAARGGGARRGRG